MEAAKFNERSVKDFGLLVFMLIVLLFFIFIKSLSLNSKNTNKSLLSTHYDFLEISSIMHKCNRFRRDLAVRISVS